MKLLTALLAALTFSGAALFSGISSKNITTTENTSFTIIELFTSEGCSSCPPADELVARISKENTGKQVYILAYHVDYWDRLGWKDPYSSAMWSKRQNQYADWFNLNTVYTPQIVVNGKTEFVGSDEKRLRKAMDVRAIPQKFSFKMVDLSARQANIQFNYPAKNNYAVYFACVQNNASMKVERGENRGRLLSHTNIVRSLQRAGEPQNLSVALPEDFNPDTWKIVGFVQNTATGEIVAATTADQK